MTKFLLVTPAFNEAEHLDAVIMAVARQSRRPDEWVIVDDGSTDATGAIVDRAAGVYPWIRPLALARVDTGSADRLITARPAKAFAAGVRSATIDWDYVGKLDADVELPPEYYEVLLDRMEEDELLGMTAGTLVEPDAQQRLRVIAVPRHHVPGAVAVYRRSCFEQIGGVREILGWDSVDETLARMRRFRTRSYDDVIAKHLRPTGAVAGVVRGRVRHGTAAWIVHYPLYFVILRSLKLALVRPRPILGLALLWGYASAAARRVPRIDDVELRAHVRRELRRRTFGGSPIRS